MNKLNELLREQRLKVNCDYAITYKYNEYHLLCHEVFEERIKEVAKTLDIEFKTIHTYA